MTAAEAQPRASLYTTTVTQAELLFGIAGLPEGRRRSALAVAATAMFAEDFAGRILPFTGAAAARYALWNSHRGVRCTHCGNGLSRRRPGRDARYCRIYGCGLVIVNPWEPTRWREPGARVVSGAIRRRYAAVRRTG